MNMVNRILQMNIPEDLTILKSISTDIELLIGPSNSHKITEYDDILKDMLDRVSIRSNGAVWLALPQVWYNKRWFVIYAYDKAKILLRWIFINPKIVWRSDRKNTEIEECLSEIWIKKLVSRHEWITLEYINMLWNKKTMKFYWYHARVIQHEMDHLDGILLIDK